MDKQKEINYQRTTQELQTFVIKLKENLKKKLQNETRQRLINNVMSKLRYIKEQTRMVYECDCLNPILHVKPEEMKYPYCTIYLENENKD